MNPYTEQPHLHSSYNPHSKRPSINSSNNNLRLNRKVSHNSVTNVYGLPSISPSIVQKSDISQTMPIK